MTICPDGSGATANARRAPTAIGIASSEPTTARRDGSVWNEGTGCFLPRIFDKAFFYLGWTAPRFRVKCASRDRHIRAPSTIRAVNKCPPCAASQRWLAHKVREPQARYLKTSSWSPKPTPFAGCQGCLAGASVGNSHSSGFWLDTAAQVEQWAAPKPAATMRARTGQGRDRLPSCPHPLWSSLRFASGCRSDR